MKSKKILTILLSLAIMFTFMPAMAFANAQPKANTWTDKVATMTDSDGDTFNTTRIFHTSSDTSATGVVEAKGIDNSPVVGKTAPAQSVWFYDFDSSMLVYGGAAGNTTKGTKLDGTTWTQSTWASLASDGIKLMMIEPDYAFGYQASAPKFYNIALNRSAKANADGSVNWVGYTYNNLYKVVAKQSKYDNAKKFEQQTVTFDVTVEPTWDGEVDGYTYADMFGKTASATITVQPAKKTASDAMISIDGDEYTAVKAASSNSLQGLYDGSAHKVVADEIEGCTVSFKVLDRSTNKYVDATEVSVTDVAEASKPVSFKVIYTNNTTKAVEAQGTHSINLRAAKANGFGFVDGTYAEVGGEVKNIPNYYITGTDYNADSYIEFVSAKRTKDDAAYKAATDDKWKAAYLVLGASYEKAASANASALMEAFKAYYDVKATPDKYNADLVRLKFDTKDLTSAEKTALDKKYEQLFRNFGANSIGDLLGSRASAAVILNADKVDEEIEFTSAPSVKTYKGSKTTKKGKLKKNQSFTVKAVSNKGRTVSYKLINANSKIKIDKTSGKITLKKGLAKGTYKIKVKAYVAGESSAAMGTIEETQAITIKIKK